MDIRIKILSVYLILIIFLASCKLDEAVEVSNQIKDISEKMSEKTTVLMQLSRQKETQETRERQWNLLKNKKNNFIMKTLNASVFYQSFEYQLWTNWGVDTYSYRESVLRLANEEFYRRIKSLFYNSKKPLKKFSPLSSRHNNEEMVFYSLAVTLHKINEMQIQFAARRPFQVISILGMLEKTLEKEFEQGEDGDYTAYEIEILREKKLALALLQGRFNMIMAMVLNDLTSMGNDDILTKAFKVYVRRKILASKLKNLSQHEKGTTIEYLQEALRGLKYLEKIEVPLKWDKTLKKIYQKLVVGDNGSKNDQLIKELLLDIVDHLHANNDD